MGSHCKDVEVDGVPTRLYHYIVYIKPTNGGGMRRIVGTSRDNALEREGLTMQDIDGVYQGFFCCNALGEQRTVRHGVEVTLTNGLKVTTTAAGAFYWGDDEGWFVEFRDVFGKYFYAKEYSDGIGIAKLGW